MNPTVSVVIPSFNHAAFVGEAIQSVLDQSFSDLEIVITDDGSSDGTPGVIRGFSDPRIRFEAFDENCGAVVALNSAIRRSRGEFICMLASDDFFLPGKLEKQVRYLRDHTGIAAVFGMPRFIDERGAQVAPDSEFAGELFRAPIQHQLQTRADWLRFFFFHCNCLCHPTVMARRTVYDAVGLFDPRLANLPDFDMWVRLCAEHDIRVMPDEVTAMRVLDNNRNMSARRRDSTLRTLNEYFEILKHYRRIPAERIAEIFARDIASHHLDADAPAGILLAQIASLGEHPPHKLFALDTMYEGAPATGGDYTKLITLTGSVDVFGVEDLRLAQGEVARLNSVLGETQTAADRSNSEFTIAQTEVARLAAELEDVRRQAIEANATLAETHAEIERRGKAIEVAQSEAMQSAASLAETQSEIVRRGEAIDVAHGEAKRLAASLTEAHAEIGRRGEAIDVAQAEATRLTAAIAETHAEIERRGEAIHAAQTENEKLAAVLASERAALARAEEMRRDAHARNEQLGAALTSEQGALVRSEKMRSDAEDKAEHVGRALRSLQVQLDEWAGSRSYGLVKLIKPLRARVEQIAATIKAGLRS